MFFNLVVIFMGIRDYIYSNLASSKNGIWSFDKSVPCPKFESVRVDPFKSVPIDPFKSVLDESS